jgi:hypothetical protein
VWLAIVAATWLAKSALVTLTATYTMGPRRIHTWVTHVSHTWTRAYLRTNSRGARGKARTEIAPISVLVAAVSRNEFIVYMTTGVTMRTVLVRPIIEVE